MTNLISVGMFWTNGHRKDGTPRVAPHIDIYNHQHLIAVMNHACPGRWLYQRDNGDALLHLIRDRDGPIYDFDTAKPQNYCSLFLNSEQCVSDLQRQPVTDRGFPCYSVRHDCEVTFHRLNYIGLTVRLPEFIR